MVEEKIGFLNRIETPKIHWIISSLTHPTLRISSDEAGIDQADTAKQQGADVHGQVQTWGVEGTGVEASLWGLILWWELVSYDPSMFLLGVLGQYHFFCLMQKNGLMKTLGIGPVSAPA